MMGKIEIRSEVRKFGISLSRLKTVTRKILKSLDVGNASLSVLFVNDRRIRSLNRRYLRHDRPTDVIAFSQLSGALPKKGRFLLGDIVISVPTARRQAHRFGNSFSYELCLYLCHGILHLLGWRDKTKREGEQMRRKQEKILQSLRVPRSGTKQSQRL